MSLVIVFVVWQGQLARLLYAQAGLVQTWVSLVYRSRQAGMV